MKKFAHFFLASNSTEGFYSLYHQLLDASFRDVMIIKGGPGSGKSSLMRNIAKGMIQQGRKVIFIHCSGDPSSLDGVIFPEIKTAIVDGTSPHVLEPRYTAISERYLDLNQGYQLEKIQTAAERIQAYSDEYRSAYQNAYHCLKAAGHIANEYQQTFAQAMDWQRWEQRVQSILYREFKKATCSSYGKQYQAFLGGMTHEGRICRFDTVETLCPKIYDFVDDARLSAKAMKTVCEVARSAGETVIACMNPDYPQEIQHVLIPHRGLAFLTSQNTLPYQGNAYRRIRVHAMAEKNLTGGQKSRLRFLKRLHRSLEEEAISALQHAKKAHDALETAYHPYIDFHFAEATAVRELRRIEQYPLVKDTEWLC